MSACFTRLAAIGFSVMFLTLAGFGQTAADAKADATTLPQSTTSSQAYAELLLKRTELQADLEALLLEYTEEYPRVKEIRYLLTLFDRETARLAKVKAADASKLSLALGRLMTRKIELEADVWKLQTSYKDEHPEVKRAKKRVEIFENAIAQILK